MYGNLVNNRFSLSEWLHYGYELMEEMHDVATLDDGG
jgi:hypothetical protein